MRKCVIFGCGQIGKAVYEKLGKIYDIIAYSDNNPALWETRLFDKEVIPPDKIKELQNKEGLHVVIAIFEYQEVCKQLIARNIKNIVVWKYGLLYQYGDGALYPIRLDDIPVYKKKNQYDFHVLFVQATACIRTHKIARALTENGIKVSLAYSMMSPQQSPNPWYTDVYDNIYPIYTYDSLLSFVNSSEFDMIHSSNQPDIFTAVLAQSNKPVVHDCHDLSSNYLNMTPEKMAIEYLANRKSTGAIYTTEGIRNVALRKFKIPMEHTLVLENLISEELNTDVKIEKLSKRDGKLHCVYEGGIVGGDRESHRFFEEIWGKIASGGVQIHFYTNCREEYCRELEKISPDIHYEGNFSSKELAVEMSKYDVGLCVLNVTKKNRQYLEYASPNKIQEYINAGLPVAVSDIESQTEFVEKNNFGKKLDLKKDIKGQLNAIAQISIPDHILHEKAYTLESRIPELIEFYEECIQRFLYK